MRLLLFLLLISSCGCQGLLRSRYAMSDPVYAERHAEGASKTDLLGKFKQAMDAGHTDGLKGTLINAGSQVSPETGDVFAELGIGTERYTSDSSTARLALTGFMGHDDWYAGFDGGVRYQTPTRLAPFIGVGGIFGVSPTYGPADDDGKDNDDDGMVDEFGEKDWSIDDVVIGAYPEIGAHFWVNGNTRLTGFGRYLVTSEGRAHDEWMLGLQFTIFTRPVKEYVEEAQSLFLQNDMPSDSELPGSNPELR